MDRVLIHQDNRQIKNYKNFAVTCMPHLQAVYSAFLALGITVSIEQINDFAGQVPVETKSTPQRDRYGMVDIYRPPVIEKSCNVSNIVRNLLLAAQTEVPAIGGLKLDNNKLKEMIQLPDTTELEKAFIELNNLTFRYRDMQLHPNWYEIDDDKVQLVADADEQITEMWSYYASSPKEIELNATLSEVAGALNKYVQYMGKSNMLGNETPELNGLHYDGSSRTYQVDHYFVTRNAKHIK